MVPRVSSVVDTHLKLETGSTALHVLMGGTPRGARRYVVMQNEGNTFETQSNHEIRQSLEALQM